MRREFFAFSINMNTAKELGITSPPQSWSTPARSSNKKSRSAEQSDRGWRLRVKLRHRASRTARRVWPQKKTCLTAFAATDGPTAVIEGQGSTSRSSIGWR
jgi:hypothetical protein